EAVACCSCSLAGVVAECLCGLATLPSTFSLRRLWQIPLVERSKRLNTGCHQFVGESIVNIDAFRIRLTGSIGKDPWPGNGKAVSGLTDTFHQLNIFLVTVV